MFNRSVRFFAVIFFMISLLIFSSSPLLGAHKKPKKENKPPKKEKESKPPQKESSKTNWQKYTFPEDDFEMSFPSKPLLDEQLQFKSHVFQTDLVFYCVDILNLSERGFNSKTLFHPKLKREYLSSILSNFLNGFTKANSNVILQIIQQEFVEYQGCPAIRFVASLDGNQKVSKSTFLIKGMGIFKNNSFYNIYFLGKNEECPEENFQLFVNSFKFLTPTSKEWDMFSFPNEGFSISFPGVPAFFTKPQAFLHECFLDFKNGLLVAIKFDDNSDIEYFKGYADFLAGINNAVIMNKTFSTLNGYPCFTIERKKLEEKNKVFHEIIFAVLKDSKIYQMVYGEYEEYFDSKIFDTFINSFQFIESSP